MLYRADLTTVLRTLARQSGELRADMERIVGIAEKCQAQVLLTEGQVTSCSIQSRSGIVLSSSDALRILYMMGVLEWTFTPASQRTSPQVAPAQALPSQNEQRPQIERRVNIGPGSFPIRIRLADQHEISTWSRLQRSVYSLVDGKKTVAEIARMLSLSGERTIEILSFLYVNQIITFSSQPHIDTFSRF